MGEGETAGGRKLNRMNVARRIALNTEKGHDRLEEGLGRAITIKARLIYRREPEYNNKIPLYGAGSALSAQRRTVRPLCDCVVPGPFL
jgi:hypothetical protein